MVVMHCSTQTCNSSNLSSDIHCFLDGRKISKLIDLVSLEEDSTAYVIGCYFGVAQGVDILFDGKSKEDQRYCLKIKAGDDFDEFEFVMYDDVVKKFAPLACSELAKENGSCNSFPQELEKFFGDPMLFKVRKEESCDSCGGILIEVLDVLIDSNIIEIYINPNDIAYSQIILGHTISDVVKSNACISKAGHGDINSIRDNSAVRIIGSAIKTNCSTLDEFIGDLEVKRLSDLSSSKDGSTSIVIGWYDSVYEGVDIWYSVREYYNDPRFRLKINVRDDIDEAIFVLFDEQGGSSCVYPHEMDVLYGDAVLFKVMTKAVESSEVANSYEIVDMLTDANILDIFFENYMPSYGLIASVSGKLSPIRVCDECSSSDYESSNEKIMNVEYKRKAWSSDEFTSEFNGKKSDKHPKII
ncbi:hypothetical protein P8452_47924 [Trifolium repens]|nr:hypothetical protein P8452_47924 [Trifolium repens]